MDVGTYPLPNCSWYLLVNAFYVIYMCLTNNFPVQKDKAIPMVVSQLYPQVHIIPVFFQAWYICWKHREFHHICFHQSNMFLEYLLAPVNEFTGWLWIKIYFTGSSHKRCDFDNSLNRYQIFSQKFLDYSALLKNLHRCIAMLLDTFLTIYRITLVPIGGFNYVWYSMLVGYTLNSALFVGILCPEFPLANFFFAYHTPGYRTL